MTLKTRLHHYCFSLHDDAQARAWKELQEKLLALGYGPRRMHSHGGTQAECKNETLDVEVELAHLFNNQWNTAAPDNHRRFDWFQQYELTSQGIARGHWLEITPEMQAARDGTLKCGYCFTQYGPFDESHRHEIPPSGGFCDACLDSPYLKESELYLLRLRAVSESDRLAIPALTAEEREELLPRYVSRQTTGGDSRAAKQRAEERERIDGDYEKALAIAEIEHGGKGWLWDNGVSLENVIFYSHTREFCFGWRSKLSEAVGEALKVKLAGGFHWKHEIKTEKGTFNFEATAPTEEQDPATRAEKLLRSLIADVEAMRTPGEANHFGPFGQWYQHDGEESRAVVEWPNLACLIDEAKELLP